MAYCDIESFTCFYTPILGCAISYESPIHIILPNSTNSSATNSTNNNNSVDLYAIPADRSAGDIVFLIFGCIALFVAVSVFIYAFITIVYEFIQSKREQPVSDIKEAPAGH